jgi:hypothetical protein
LWADRSCVSLPRYPLLRAIPSAVDPHTVERAWPRTPRWSALPGTYDLWLGRTPAGPDPAAARGAAPHAHHGLRYGAGRPAVPRSGRRPALRVGLRPVVEAHPHAGTPRPRSPLLWSAVRTTFATPPRPWAQRGAAIQCLTANVGGVRWLAWHWIGAGGCRWVRCGRARWPRAPALGSKAAAGVAKKG